MPKIAKYEVEAFRNCEIAGEEVKEGTVLADIIPKGDYTVADINQAVADGLAEIVPVKATEEVDPAGGASE